MGDDVRGQAQDAPDSVHAGPGLCLPHRQVTPELDLSGRARRITHSDDTCATLRGSDFRPFLKALGGRCG